MNQNLNIVKEDLILKDPLLDQARELTKNGTIGDVNKIRELIADINYEAGNYKVISAYLKYNYDTFKAKEWIRFKETPNETTGKMLSDRTCDIHSKEVALDKYGSYEVRYEMGRRYVRAADQLKEKLKSLEIIDYQQKQNTEF